MGKKFQVWRRRSEQMPSDYGDLANILRSNRDFQEIDQLRYGDHGLQAACDLVKQAIQANRRIALYADYDVDGTMSCVSWIWFFKAIGFQNFLHYIPCRFKEGYGLNMQAMQHLIDDQKAELVITMDTGITANEEAAYCRSRGVDFICTDHHKVQPEKMPDCVILNPKLHPEPDYQELCGCGITFVLLRQLDQEFRVEPSVWNDILALVGMATICDVVPLNSVNHKLANLGIKALLRSQRPVLRKLREACALVDDLDEKDVGFRIGPRINAVGRLQHANIIIDAFVREDPDELIRYMDRCNEQRKLIQNRIYQESIKLAETFKDEPILFLGGDWHPGVVGIAASKLTEKFWRPSWLFHREGEFCKGSARSVPGFDVTEAMREVGHLFEKFGGHAAAAGYMFRSERESEIREALNSVADSIRRQRPDVWQSKVAYDCDLPWGMARLDLATLLDDMKPFGHGYEDPLFCVSAPIQQVRFYKDKISGEPKHTAVLVGQGAHLQKIMFFNEVHEELEFKHSARFLVSAGRNRFRGELQLNLIGRDFEAL